MSDLDNLERRVRRYQRRTMIFIVFTVLWLVSLVVMAALGRPEWVIVSSFFVFIVSAITIILTALENRR